MGNPPERTNYGLCPLSRDFDNKPYCNQMGGFLNSNVRFCDVCGGSWELSEGKWNVVKEGKGSTV
jgi:hypothetical protein